MNGIKRTLISITLCLSLFLMSGNLVNASDLGECIDGSYLTNDDVSEGMSGPMTKGIHLRSGSSSISKAGTGMITAGGTTIAQKIVSTVSVTVRVERLVNGSWQTYTSWSSTRYDAASATTSRTLSVPTGYYYRAHCFHSANSDSSGSYTNGLWI